MLKQILITNIMLKDINPRECGEEDCSPGYSVGPISKDYYLLHYVFSGKGYYYVDSKEYTVGKGQIFIIRPNEIVTYRADTKDPWYYSWVGFESSLPQPSLDNNDVIDLPQAEHIFWDLKDCDQMHNQREYYICGKIYTLMTLFDQPVITDKTYEHILKAKNYIDSNYSRYITISSLAKHLNLNRSYFSSAFKKYIGKSPKQYLIDVRLQKAAELISTYGYSATIAAQSTGYTDIFNFSKMFKQKFGVPPTLYSKNCPKVKKNTLER